VRVFISSVVAGFEEYREAVGEAIGTLGHDIVRSEEFRASPATPRRVCLAEVREADLTLVLLGSRYGEIQDSGLSATHEEFREARDRGTALVYVQEGIEFEEAQTEFVAEAREWATGNLTFGFNTPDSLRAAVTRDLHEYIVRQTSGEVDAANLHERAVSQMARTIPASRPAVHVAVAGGPDQTVLRPTELEDPALANGILQQALFGAESIFTVAEGVDTRLSDGRLSLIHPAGLVEVDEMGTVHVALLAQRDDQTLVLEEETVLAKITLGIRLVGWILDQVDPHHRLGTVAVVAALTDASWLGWQTAEERARNPNVVSMGVGFAATPAVPSSPHARPRASLLADSDRIAADLLALLQRSRQQ
jgi:hypothetical protein